MIDLDEDRFEKIMSTNILQFGFENTMVKYHLPVSFTHPNVVAYRFYRAGTEHNESDDSPRKPLWQLTDR
jgi:hypothetical protein